MSRTGRKVQLFSPVRVSLHDVTENRRQTENESNCHSLPSEQELNLAEAGNEVLSRDKIWPYAV